MARIYLCFGAPEFYLCFISTDVRLTACLVHPDSREQRDDIKNQLIPTVKKF
jgi:hypothetical protein